MAAEYILYTKNHLHKDDLVSLFKRLNWIHVQEKLGEKTTLFSFNDTIGFHLYFNVRIETTFEIANHKYDFINAITFRFSNESDFLKSKTNMLRFIIEMSKINDDDFVLLFNGELVIMIKNGEDGLVISNTDFWSEELLKEVSGVNFRRRNFEVL